MGVKPSVQYYGVSRIKVGVKPINEHNRYFGCFLLKSQLTCGRFAGLLALL